MVLRKNSEWSVTRSCPGSPGKRGMKLEKERMKREHAGREGERERERGRKQEKTEWKKHDRKSGHLQDRDRVTSRPFIKEESRFHS